MEHTPNKQSKTDCNSLQTNFTNSVLKSVSQGDDLDLEYEQSNFGSEFESQSYYQSSFSDFPQTVASSVSSSTLPSVNFQANRSVHSLTPAGDNFSSYQKTKTVQSVTPRADDQPAMSCLPSQLDSVLDLGYSSTSGGSSYQGQDKDSQRDNLTADQGSQLDIPMSPGAAWSDENCGENYLHGENELEDLLFYFHRFFEDRFESELNQFRESIHGIIHEQQSHVRQIIHRATCMREQNSQNSSDEQPQKGATSISQPQSDVVSRLLDGTLYIPNEELCSLRLNREPRPSSDERRTKLLELLADSCSISSLLTKAEFR